MTLLTLLSLPCLATGNMAEGGNAGNGGLVGAAEDIGRAVEDLLPGNNTRGDRTETTSPESSADLMDDTTDNPAESDVINDHTDRESGVTDDGNTTGNAPNGMVGESDTLRETESETILMGTDTTETSSTNWVGIIIALLIIAALAAVVLALIPKKKKILLSDYCL